MDSQILLIDKPAGMTSFGVVARVRRILTERAGHKVKVGHTGTLDPFATGLLILLTGKNTKRSNEFLKLDKWYEATIRLGQTSTTGDPEGEIMDYESPDESKAKEFSGISAGYGRSPLGTWERSDGEAARHPQRRAGWTATHKVPDSTFVSQTLHSFVGANVQRVPAFSAVKINGRRAYELARKGLPVDTPTRQVEIYSIELLDYDYPNLKIRTHVSSGTYIRTLGEDIGQALGTGAYLTALRRTRIGDYDIENATALSDFMGSK